jgi:hypothetical protein
MKGYQRRQLKRDGDGGEEHEAGRMQRKKGGRRGGGE